MEILNINLPNRVTLPVCMYKVLHDAFLLALSLSDEMKPTVLEAGAPKMCYRKIEFTAPVGTVNIIRDWIEACRKTMFHMAMHSYEYAARLTIHDLEYGKCYLTNIVPVSVDNMSHRVVFSYTRASNPFEQSINKEIGEEKFVYIYRVNCNSKLEVTADQIVVVEANNIADSFDKLEAYGISGGELLHHAVKLIR